MALLCLIFLYIIMFGTNKNTFINALSVHEALFFTAQKHTI